MGGDSLNVKENVIINVILKGFKEYSWSFTLEIWKRRMQKIMRMGDL